MQKRKVVIFGTGETGKYIYDNMLKDNQEVLFFVDNNTTKWGGKCRGKEIKNPKVLSDYHVYDQVIIGTMGYGDVREQLLALGVPAARCEEKYAKAVFKMKKGWSFGKFLRRYLTKLLRPFGYGPISERAIEKNNLLNAIQTDWGIYKKDEYETRWRKICEQYDFVRIFNVGGRYGSIGSIGETIQRYFAIRHNETNEDSRTLKVFLMLPMPSWPIPRICNRELLKLFNQHIYVPQGEDVLFWMYVCRNYFDEVDCSELEKYERRDSYPTYKVELGRPEFAFAEEEIKFAEEQMQKMQITKDFVCVAARTSAYNLKTRGWDGGYALEKGKSTYDFRNMDFDTYACVIDYLEQNGFQTVRMGREESALFSPIGGCIDYAGKGANDLMDLYLAAHCKFFLTGASGICQMASLFGKPVMMVNAAQFSFCNGGTPYTEKDLYIPKKYYDMRKKKYLSLMEIAGVEQECFVGGYEERGVCVEDNTPEEIRDAVIEFLGRLNGTWEDTEEDIENYERYEQIHVMMSELTKRNSKIERSMGGPLPYRLAATYLKKNKYLLQ